MAGFAHTLNRVQVNIASGALLRRHVSVIRGRAFRIFLGSSLRIFKKYTGTTPLEYRKRAEQEGIPRHDHEPDADGCAESSMQVFISHRHVRIPQIPLSVRACQGTWSGNSARPTGHHRPYKAASCCNLLPDESSGAGCGGKCRVYGRSFSRAFNKYKMTPGEYRSLSTGGETNDKVQKLHQLSATLFASAKYYSRTSSFP